MSWTRPSTPMIPRSTTTPSSSAAFATSGYTRICALTQFSRLVSNGSRSRLRWNLRHSFARFEDGGPSATGAAGGESGAWDDPATADSLDGSDGGGGTAVFGEVEEAGSREVRGGGVRGGLPAWRTSLVS